MLAEDFFQKGTFDLHPHRGIETVTYVMDGTLEHFDNKAGHGKLEPGQVLFLSLADGVSESSIMITAKEKLRVLLYAE